MIRRWAAWLVVVAALVAMSVIRLADRKERVPRELSNVTRHEPSTPAPGGGR
jgi:hypothetical protein